MSKPKKSWQHKVKNLKTKTRISDYCGQVFPILGSKSATKKAIAKERIFLNGKVASTADFLRNGDFIELKGTGIKAIKKLDVQIPIIYEDEYLMIVNKSGGIAVNGNRYKTVENAFAHHNQNNQQEDALPRPIAAHRIDVPTCGLVVLAKTKTAQIQLGKAFQNNQIKKTYIAIAHGTLAETGTFDQAIDDKNATTHFKVLKKVPSQSFGHLTKVELQPVTGRTHQLRIHLSNAGHPIVGDKMYLGEQKTILGKGVLLCASRLVFKHPITNEDLNIHTEPPAKFNRVLEREEARYKR